MSELQRQTEEEIWDRVRPRTERRLQLGEYYSEVIRHDTRWLLFSLSRYKFAAKLLGTDPALTVLELGCNEGVGSLLLAEVAKQVTAVDFDEASIAWAQGNLANEKLSFRCDNFLGKTYGSFDAVVSVDVIEHVLPENAPAFRDTILDNLAPNGFCLVGTPNATASAHASESSKEGHVNLYRAQELKAFFQEKFHNVFLFGMNDEVVHTGYYDMCHYLFVLACNRK